MITDKQFGLGKKVSVLVSEHLVLKNLGFEKLSFGEKVSVLVQFFVSSRSAYMEANITTPILAFCAGGGVPKEPKLGACIIRCLPAW